MWGLCAESMMHARAISWNVAFEHDKVGPTSNGAWHLHLSSGGPHPSNHTMYHS